MPKSLPHKNYCWWKAFVTHTLRIWFMIWAIWFHFVREILDSCTILALLMWRMLKFAHFSQFEKVIFKTLMLDKFIVKIFSLLNSLYHFNWFWKIFFLFCCLNYLTSSISYFTIIFFFIRCLKNHSTSISQIGSSFNSFFFFLFSFLF